MADLSAARLRTLAAELRREVQLIQRSVAELQWVADQPSSEAAQRIQLYAAAAMLDTFYTGVERALERIARTFQSLPDGPNWHRALLDESALDVPRVRPAVLRSSTAHEMGRYLGFRHRFRNLYLFDLDGAQMRPLVDGAGAASEAACADLGNFADQLDALADAL